MARINVAGLTLGPNAAAVKHAVSPQQWRQIVHSARSQGFTVDSYLDPNAPTALKERTPQYLRQQAVTNVGTAYAPAYKELTGRAAQVKALDAKRESDLQYYNNWLNAQHESLVAGATTADNALKASAETLQASTGAAYDQAKQGAIAQLSQLPGTVSNFSGANALGEIDAHKASGVGEVGATGGQALDNINTAQGMQQLAGANNFATIAALEAKRIGDTWTANQGIADDRYKLDTAQAQDISKAISDSAAGELTKAQSNRDYAAVAQKLNLQAQGQQSLAQSRRSTARHQAQTLAETQRHNQQMEAAKRDATSATGANAEANFEAKWGVSRKTFLSWSDPQRQSYLQRARQRGIITGGGKPKSGPAAFSPTQLRGSQRDYRSALSWAQSHKPSPGEMNQLVQALQAPKAQGQTVHDPATGKIVYNKDGTPKRTGGGGFGLSDPLLAKAVAQVAIYGGVDAQTAKRVKAQYGISLPAQKKVSFSPKGPKLYTKTK